MCPIGVLALLGSGCIATLLVLAAQHRRRGDVGVVADHPSCLVQDRGWRAMTCPSQRTVTADGEAVTSTNRPM